MSVGVVAIGRNEGQRLAACLASALRDAATVIYVDSGSTDGSIELARSLGAAVVELDRSIPFTAARARNEGAAKLLAIAPATQFIQFVDGDCELVAEWIAAATALMAAEPRAAVACGRRRERFPAASRYNRLCDIEWNTPVGVAKACGGDALVRVAAFEQVGGYDGGVIAGEEPEMCLRLRQAGWTIHRLDAEMTLHDAAMTRFSQWWKRNLRAGHAYAQGQSMHGQPPELHGVKETRSNFAWGIALPAALLVIGVAATSANPRWGWLAWSLWLVFPLQAVRVARHMRRRGLNWGDALLYGGFTVLGKVPQALGAMEFYRNRRRGRSTALIEYKTAGV